MEDEQQLASLVLLLRLSTVVSSPQNNNGNNEQHGDGISSPSSKPSSVDESTPPPSPLQKALEENDCNLLLFIGRLIHAYNNDVVVTSNNSAEDNTTSKISTSYALLRLVIHVLFLRYTEESKYNTTSYNNNNSRVEECEQYLLHKLLPVTLRARASLEMEEVDVQIAWIMRGIILRHSQQGSLWIEYIEALMNRRLYYYKGEGGLLSPLQNVTTTTTAADDDDEKLMVQTIHSILDGRVKSTQDAGDEPNNDNETNLSNNIDIDYYWNLEFNKALVDCIQSFLQHATPVGGGDSCLRLKESTMFGMIQFSQQSDALSVHVYLLLLQYLRMCMQSSDNSVLLSFKNCFVAQEEDGVDGNSKSEDTISASVRSFVFYGMAVLGNTVASSSSSNNQQEYIPPSEGAVLSTLSQISLKGLRAEVYTLAMNLWRSFGPDWLFFDSSNTNSSSVLSNGFWWFRSQNTENQLGLTWPLCTLVQLAAGDLRLNLGRWITLVEEDNASSQDNEYICSEIESCATVILQTVQLMTSLADDDEGEVVPGVWVPEALLHIRKSLEDALNSSVQYLNSFFCDQNESRTAASDQANKVGRICCVLVGTIASELEVEDLLISSSIDEGNMQLTKEAESSCFASALAAGMLLCNSLGEKNVTNLEERLETCEPLCCLLPCTMSVVACLCSNEKVQHAISSLYKDGRLVHVMSRFLCRVGERWKRLDKRLSQIDEAFAILSIVGLCLLIIEELVTSSIARAEYQELRSPLKVWREILLEVESEAEDALKEHVEQTLQQVDNCLILLRTYQ